MKVSIMTDNSNLIRENFFFITVIELVTNKKLRFGTSLINSILTREFFFFLAGESKRKQVTKKR
jgi:hypothetical protein